MEDTQKTTEAPVQEANNEREKVDMQAIEQTVKFGASKDFIMMACAIVLLTERSWQVFSASSSRFLCVSSTI